MRTTAMLLVTNLASIVCVCAAAYLCFQGKDGWGWFLFVGLLLAGGLTISNSEKGDKKTTKINN